MKHPRIALFGFFGIQNIGNECTLQAMLYNLRERLPDAEFYCIGYEPGDIIKRHGLAAVPISARYSPTTQASHLPRARNKLVKLLRAIFHGIPREFWSWRQALQILKGTDLVMMTGTGMLTDFSGTSFGYPYDIFKWTVTAKLAGCKVRFVGIGVGPIYERLSRQFIKSALAIADYRSYRDSFSKNRLNKIGIDATEDPVFPDLAFSLPKDILPQGSNHDKHERIVGVGIINLFDYRAMEEKNRHALYQTYLEKMAEFIAWLVEKNYGVRILQGDARYDGSVRQDLRSKLQQRGIRYANAGIVDEDILSVQDLLAQLAVTDLVVASRYHNQIFAILLGKPVISLSYDPKSDVLLEGVGLGRYCQPLYDLDVDKLKQQLIELERYSENLKAQLLQKTEDYRRLLAEQYQILLKDI